MTRRPGIESIERYPGTVTDCVSHPTLGTANESPTLYLIGSVACGRIQGVVKEGGCLPSQTGHQGAAVFP